MALAKTSDDAEGLLESAIIQHSSGRFNFLDERETIEAPAAVDTARAIVALHRGDVKSAMAFARQSEEMEPVVSDDFLSLINGFSQSGHAAEADALRKQASEFLENLLGKFPDSPSFANDLAWLLARSGGNLDQALTQALHATQLDPNSTAIADTLAEVYFRRGDLPKAVEAIQKCIQLEPDRARHRKRLETFQAALAQRQH